MSSNFHLLNSRSAPNDNDAHSPPHAGWASVYKATMCAVAILFALSSDAMSRSLFWDGSVSGVWGETERVGVTEGGLIIWDTNWAAPSTEIVIPTSTDDVAIDETGLVLTGNGQARNVAMGEMTYGGGVLNIHGDFRHGGLTVGGPAMPARMRFHQEFTHTDDRTLTLAEDAWLENAAGVPITMINPRLATIRGQGRISGLDIVNSGGIIAEGDDLQLNDLTITEFGGTGSIAIAGDSNLIMLRSRIVGGVINTQGDGLLRGQGELIDATVTDLLTTSGQIGLGGQINNAGVITSKFFPGSAASWDIDGAATLIGGGELLLADNVQITGAGTLTNSADHRVTGAGSITARLHNHGELAGTSSQERIRIFGELTGSGSISNVEIVGVHKIGAEASVQQASGDYRLNGEATSVFELGSLADFDRLVSVGSVSLDGELRLEIVNGAAYLPSPGDSFTLVDVSGELSGRYDNTSAFVPFGGDDALAEFVINYTADSVTASFAGVTAPGDFNRDGVVDAADYTTWRDHLGSTSPTVWLNGDGNGDGKVDSHDYLVWQSQYGMTSADVAGLQLAGSQAVPEPSALALAVVVAISAGHVQRSSQPKTVRQ